MPCILLCTLLATGIGGGSPARAEVTTSITQTTGAGDLGTQVLLPIGHVYGITGGTPAGTNLYHSFAQFNVGTGDIAQFQTGTIPNIEMLNILGRITDANPSTIFGTIDSATFYPNANFFLMNPYGFLFGPGAMVNVGGMVAFTSADYLRLGDLDSSNAGIFHADPAQARILANAPVAAFGFLGSNPGAITVQGSQFTVTDGQSITLVGVNIAIQSGTLNDGTVQPARLSAPGGQINLVSVASAGEVLNGTLESAPNINGSSFTAMGDIRLSQGATLTVSGDAAGTVRIRGGQFVIADATLSADTGNAKGTSALIDINVTGDMSITDTRGVPAISARTLGSGDAGAIRITSGNLTATSSFVDPSFLPTSLIDSHTSGDGRGGDVHITTGDLAVTGTTGPSFLFIDSGTARNGRGGNVTINAETVDLDFASISTGQFASSALLKDTSGVNGSAGNVTIIADTLHLKDSVLDTSASLGLSEFQKGGDITITASDISMKDTQVTSLAIDGGGTFTIKANSFVTDFTSFETDTVSGQGGAISVEAHVVELTNGSSLISTTFGDGNVGNVSLTATTHVKILGDVGTNPAAASQPSGIFSNSFGFVGSQGNAGNVIVTTPKLEIVAGRINTVTASSGQGGNVTLNVTDSISISGEFPSDQLIVPSVFDIGPLAPSGIVTSTVGNEFCAGPCGNAGNVSINTGSLSLGSGSQINSGTSSSGQGGSISVNAGNTISISGTLSTGQPGGIQSRTVSTDPDAAGGNIALTARQSVTISNGAAVSASSTGTGIAGDITINAGNQFAMTNSSVTTEANRAGGGTIKITTTPSGTVELNNSTISASVLDGTGGGGSVNIDPQYVLLQNSQILAQAVQGPGGIITINITNGGLFLPDANSVISASSQFGVNGTVTIQSPNAPISGHIQPLGKTPLIATSLLNQRCAALAGGEFSSFIVTGRDSLPTEPGSWHSSPLAFATRSEGSGLGTKAEGVKAEGERPKDMSASAGQVVSGQWRVGDTPILSLRQIAPAGFLTQTFAVEGSSSCQS